MDNKFKNITTTKKPSLLGSHDALGGGPRLKICGMKYPENIQAIAALQPDYLGFIFYEKSARYFEGSIPELPKIIKKVGVFVNAPVEEIVSKIKKYDLQAVQLHGDESPEFCSALRHAEAVSATHKKDPKQVQVEIIKVFSIKDAFDFSILKAYEPVCDYFLFDTKGKLPGGNGYAFDWKVLKDYPSAKPFFLSGGIGPEHVDDIKEIASLLHGKDHKSLLHSIDVNSKFEIKPGLKNIEKLKEFNSKIK